MDFLKILSAATRTQIQGLRNRHCISCGVKLETWNLKLETYLWVALRAQNH